jgi:hypothetical protein
MSVKPNTASGKISWCQAGTNAWKALGLMDECPFVAPERLLRDINPVGVAYNKQKFVQQKPADVSLEMNVINFEFVAGCLQSDPLPAPATFVRTFVYREQYVANVPRLIDVAYDDGVIRYVASNCVIKAVIIRSNEGEQPQLIVTLSVPKIAIGAPTGTLVAFSETDELSVADTSLKIGSDVLEIITCEFRIEPRAEHGNVVGVGYDTSVNYGNLKLTLEFEAFYDTSKAASIGSGATWTPDPTLTYTFQVGNSDGAVGTHHYFRVVLANPTEGESKPVIRGDQGVRISKTLNANAATMTAVDKSKTEQARYWVVA